MSDFTNHRDDVVPSIETEPSSGLQNAKASVVNSEVRDLSATKCTCSKLTLKQCNQASELLEYHPTNLPTDASAAADAVKNHPITQNITNGMDWPYLQISWWEVKADNS